MYDKIIHWRLFKDHTHMYNIKINTSMQRQQPTENTINKLKGIMNYFAHTDSPVLFSLIFTQFLRNITIAIKNDGIKLCTLSFSLRWKCILFLLKDREDMYQFSNLQYSYRNKYRCKVTLIFPV